MTDQPAAPTPGPYAALAKAAERDRLKAANEHWHTRVTQLKADNEALETERDRFKVVNEGLVKALKEIDEAAGASWVAGRARAALDEARQS